MTTPRNRGHVQALLAAAATAAALSSCASLKIVDTLDDKQPKGYVSFFAETPLTIDQVEHGQPREIGSNTSFWRGLIPEYRMAFPPGEHAFLLHHRDNTFPVTVTVRQNAVTYVSVHYQSLFWYQGTYTAGGVRTTTTSAQYNVGVSVGSTALPPASGGSLPPEVVAALGDRDWGTRLAALHRLPAEKEKLEPAVLATVQRLATEDRYAAVRDQAMALLGQQVPPSLLYFDTFEHNVGGWQYGDTPGRRRYFNQLGYHLDSQVTGSQWSTTDVSRLLAGAAADSFDLELDTAWMGGVNDNAYGLLLGNGKASYYDFCISRNGGATSHLVKDGSTQLVPIAWTQKAKSAIAKRETDRLRVEVRKGRMSFYVDDVLIDSVAYGLGLPLNSIGVVVYDGQAITFSRLRLTAK